MNVRELLVEAVADTVSDAIGDQVNGVFDCDPVRAARPYAWVDEPVLADWSTKDMAGREGRFAVLLYDAGERPARLRALCGAVEEALESLPTDLGEGWHLLGPVLARSRIVREGEMRWMATIEWRVAMLRES